MFQGKIRAGVAGIGQMGTHHVRVLKSHPAFDVAGVFDVKRERVEETAGQLQVPACYSEDELIEKSDVLVIACDTRRHGDWIRKALKAGKPFLVEKPVVSDAAELNDILTDLPKNFPAMAGHIERFNPAIRAAGNLPVGSKIFEFIRHAPFTPRGADVSVVMDLMVHDLDILWQWKPEMPVQVMASDVEGVGVDADYMLASLMYADGTMASLSASRLAHERIRKIRCVKEGWQLDIDLAQAAVVQTFMGNGAGSLTIPVEPSNALADEYEAWACVLRKEIPPPVSLNDACQILRLAEMIIQASKK